jgi:hypothetical protein
MTGQKAGPAARFEARQKRSGSRHVRSALHSIAMGEAHVPEKVKLTAGLLAGDEDHFLLAQSELERTFGRIEHVSDTWPFWATHFYDDELGPSVVRRFVSFGTPFEMDCLAEVKLATNELELELTRRLSRPAGDRPVNIDPGYVTLASLVLATTKNRAHRIYLGRGIFAEVTLLYERGGWRALPWTYPDYAASTYHPFLSRVRQGLKAQRRSGACDAR